MIEVRVLQADGRGLSVPARFFPFTIGRGEKDQLRIESPGVWDHHLEIRLSADGIVAVARPEAMAFRDGEPFREGILRNGDELTMGDARLRIWLDAPVQKPLRVPLFLTALTVIAVPLVELCLIMWLAQ